MKTKLIASGSDCIDKYINDWIEKEKPVRIYDIKYQFTAFRDKLESYHVLERHTALILYDPLQE